MMAHRQVSPALSALYSGPVRWSGPGPRLVTSLQPESVLLLVQPGTVTADNGPWPCGLVRCHGGLVLEPDPVARDPAPSE